VPPLAGVNDLDSVSPSQSAVYPCKEDAIRALTRHHASNLRVVPINEAFEELVIARPHRGLDRPSKWWHRRARAVPHQVAAVGGPNGI
jgi:hypothetical protein